MKSTLFIQLKPGKDAPVKRFHPWVFSGAIAKQSPNLQDGDWVNVVSSRDEFLGTGHYHNGSIAVKIISFQEIESKSDFWKKRIQNAWDLRALLPLEKTNAFRLLHGEGDGCPGLIMDLYKDVLVFQAHTIGMHRDRDEIVEAVKEVLGKKIKAIYDKSRETLPTEYAQNCTNGYVYGDVAVPYTVKENGISFSINWITGQKTGFFIDQRENRALLGKYAQGKKVLNTFCYSGGFSLQALQHGATLVHSLDSSKKAIALTDANVELNAFHERHASIVDDAMDYMKNLAEDYDIIVLDPPAFAKHRDKRHQAIQGYKRLNAHAIRQIKPGGLIFTFSCSQVVDTLLFTNTVIAAAIEAGRSCRILDQLHQPADHPIQAFHPEGAYLKGLVIQID